MNRNSATTWTARLAMPTRKPRRRPAHSIIGNRRFQNARSRSPKLPTRDARRHGTRALDSRATVRAKVGAAPFSGDTLPDIATTEPPRIRRRHVTAAVIGNALEFYDFTIYAFFSVSIGQAFFPSGPGGLTTSEFGSLMASLG